MQDITKDHWKAAKNSLVGGIELCLQEHSHSQENVKEFLNVFTDYFVSEDLKEMSSIIKKNLGKPTLKQHILDYSDEVSKKMASNPLYLKQLFNFNVRENRPLFGAEIWPELLKNNRDFLFDFEAAFKHSASAILASTSEKLTPNGYILNVKNNGQLIPRIMCPKSRKLDDIAGYGLNWFNLSHHAPFFMQMNPEMVSELVNDNERWVRGHWSDELPKWNSGNYIGRQLFGFGLEHKTYASTHPHKIILENHHFDSITVKDCLEGLVAFKAKSANKEISMGFMQYTPEYSDIARPISNESEREAYKILDTANFSSSSFTPYSNMFGITTLFQQSGLLCGLVGAIARDMFVYERKQKFYIEGEKRGPRTRSNPRPTSTVIWLPRQKIEYIGLPPKSEEEFGKVVWDIAPSDVPGHIRKCANPSAKQLELARRYEINVPLGHTFVKPHHRGAYTRGPSDYKSRSALQVLFSSGNQ